MPQERQLTLWREGRGATIQDLVIAGWTGRDAAAVRHHIEELERIGVKAPKTTPIFYRVAADLLTSAPRIQVIGTDSSGEVEPVVFSLDDGLWVGVGSDHTDRKAEAVGVTLSKQLCAKPVGTTLWSFAEVAGHWDQLVLRSYAVRGSERQLYQEGTLAGLRRPEELMKMYTGGGELPRGTAMFGGTMAVRGAIGGADAFELELEDPVLKRRLAHRYAIETLSIEG